MIESFYLMNKVLVKEYYRLNAGFFLVIGVLTFGFMSDVEHIALAQFFTSSPYLMLIPVFVWMMYMHKVIQFNRRQLRLPENLFLYHFSLLNVPAKVVTLMCVIMIQFTPVLLYGTFLILMAAHAGMSPAIGEVISGLIIFLSIATARLFFQLNRPHREIKITAVKKLFDHHFTRSVVQFYTGWALRREPILLMATKLFNGLLIYAVAKLYGTEAYDWRLMAMGAVLAFSGNFMIILHLHRFENFHFMIIRNLPIALLKRLLILVIVLLILCIPEIILLIRYFPENLHPIYTFLLIMLGVSSNVVFYSTMFLPGLIQKDFARLTFAVIMACIVLILFKVPVVLLIFVQFTIGVLLFNRFYYSFEVNTSDTQN